MTGHVKKLAIAVGGLLAAGLLSAAVYAAAADPGSEGDPLVTKSYVDQLLSKMGAVFVPLEVKEGQKLVGSEGTELILRSGEATAVGAEENGVSDLTAGKDLMTGDIVEANHLLIVPRGDGRGITAETDVWLMIKGGYSLAEPQGPAEEAEEQEQQKGQ
ncbi:MAG: hypothetical protein LBH39_03800 [Clostridiales Family XIII bacterium]|jgi:hypothetical protein|nr:hypothetical protein [Clostridiales Family XIII bacterium]